MREILFRGIDSATGKWVQGDLLHISSGCIIYHGSQIESEIKENAGAAIELLIDEVSVVDPETVGQFTGLTDKSGVKIFEGDIITVNSKIVKQVRINDTFLSVQVANKEDLKFIDLLDPWQSPGKVWWNYFGREIIVIGNIYDNPELLI